MSSFLLLFSLFVLLSPVFCLLILLLRRLLLRLLLLSSCYIRFTIDGPRLRTASHQPVQTAAELQKSADPSLQRRGAWEGFVFALVSVMITITTDASQHPDQ